MENKVKLHRTRHNKTKSDVNNNVISVFVNFKRYFILIYQFNSNKTKITKPPLLQHQNNSKSNSLSDTMNIITKKKKINKTYIKAKALTTNNSVFFSQSPFKTKKLSTLSKSNIIPNKVNLRLKKKPQMFINNKLNLLYEIESKILIIQKNIRRYLAQVKLEKLKVTPILQGGMCDCNPNIDFMFSFKNDNNINSNSIDYSNTSIDNYIAKNSLTKNKSSILLGEQTNNQLNKTLSSVRSGVSRVSINSNDYDYSDEDYDENDF